MISIRLKKSANESETSTSHFLLPERETRNGFLHFSQKVDYGLFLMAELAQKSEGEPISLRTVAKKNMMSFFFLQKVAFDLRKGGLIQAHRGKSGGYVLVRKPECISLCEVLETLEGPFELISCTGKGPEHSFCEREKNCHMREGIGQLATLIRTIFSRTTLADLFSLPWKKHLPN